MNWYFVHPWMFLFMFFVVFSTIDTLIKALAGAYKPRKHCGGCPCEHHDDGDDDIK